MPETQCFTVFSHVLVSLGVSGWQSVSWESNQEVEKRIAREGKRHTSSWKIKGGWPQAWTGFYEERGRGGRERKPGYSHLMATPCVWPRTWRPYSQLWPESTFQPIVLSQGALKNCKELNKKEIPWGVVGIIPLCGKLSHRAEASVPQHGGHRRLRPLARCYLPYCPELLACEERTSEDTEEGSEVPFLVLSFILEVSARSITVRVFNGKE